MESISEEVLKALKRPHLSVCKAAHGALGQFCCGCTRPVKAAPQNPRLLLCRPPWPRWSCPTCRQHTGSGVPKGDGRAGGPDGWGTLTLQPPGASVSSATWSRPRCRGRQPVRALRRRARTRLRKPCCHRTLVRPFLPWQLRLGKTLLPPLLGPCHYCSARRTGAAQRQKSFAVGSLFWAWVLPQASLFPACSPTC